MAADADPSGEPPPAGAGGVASVPEPNSMFNWADSRNVTFFIRVGTCPELHRFTLGPSVESCVTIGRSPDADISVELPGISWSHAEFHWMKPADPKGLPRIGIVDTSSCCTGMKVPNGKVDRLRKNMLYPVPHGSVFVMPMKVKVPEGRTIEEFRVCLAFELDCGQMAPAEPEVVKPASTAAAKVLHDAPPAAAAALSAAVATSSAAAAKSPGVHSGTGSPDSRSGTDPFLPSPPPLRSLDAAAVKEPPAKRGRGFPAASSKAASAPAAAPASGGGDCEQPPQLKPLEPLRTRLSPQEARQQPKKRLPEPIRASAAPAAPAKPTMSRELEEWYRYMLKEGKTEKAAAAASEHPELLKLAAPGAAAVRRPNAAG